MFIKRFSQSAVALAVSSICFSPQVMANEVDEDLAAIEQISVWSTQVKTSSLYLKGEDIANKQADHLSDLLRTIAGVDVGGAHSLNQRITIRSMDDKDLNISIDGAAQNTYMYHHMGNLQIHSDILKSVDIDLGTNSVINGGLGGSVRFETKEAAELLKQDQKFGGRIHASTGNNSGRNYSVTGYGLLTDNLDVLAYYNVVNRDDYEVGGSQIKDSEGNEIAGTDGTVKGLEGELDDMLVKLGWDLNENQRLSLSYESYTDQGDYSYRPDMGLATDIAITNSLKVPLLWPTEFTRETFTLNYALNWGDASELTATAFSNISELQRDESGWLQNPDYADWAGKVKGEAKNSGLNILAQTSIDGLITDLDQHDFIYGIDHTIHHTDYQANYVSGNTDISDEKITSTALFIQDRIALGYGFTVIPGVRYVSYEIDSKVVNDTYKDTAFALAAEYQVNDSLLFKASTTEIFKGPEIGEVFTGAGLRDKENQNIDAERGRNSELAFAYQTPIFGDDTFSLGATVFNTKINDYIYDIAAVPNGGPRDSWKDNIGDMEIDGVEAYLGYEKGALNAQISFSSADSELDAFSDYGSLDGARLDRKQGDTLSGHVRYFIEHINVALNWEVLNVDKLEAGLDLDGASLDNAKQGYTVHNISARWEPNMLEGMALLVGVDNMFDEYYSSQSSRTGVSFHPRFGDLFLTDYEPGRNIKASVSYQF